MFLTHAGKHAGCQWPAMALSRSLGASIASTCGVSSEPEVGRFKIFGSTVDGSPPTSPYPQLGGWGCGELGSVVGTVIKPWMEGVPWNGRESHDNPILEGDENEKTIGYY